MRPSAETGSRSERVSVAIVGARGYSGLELARLLLKHPRARIEACVANDKAFKLGDYLPEQAAAGVPVLPMSELDALLPKVQVIFLATPAQASTGLAARAVAAGVDVIDLSGAFRLPPFMAKEWYGVGEECRDLLMQAEFGLVPWAGPDVVRKGPRLISNPGCYATSVLMALLPLLREKLIEPESLVIDAKSGATGAGRKAEENLLYCEVEGECLPYRVGKHQHLPEIREHAAKLGGVAIDPFFTTHLLAVRRGILSGLYARVRSGVTLEQVERAYASAYEGYPLARWGKVEGASQGLSLKRIAGTARTEIRYELNDGKLYVFSVIDNLLKGAAGQAVENFNRLLDLPVGTALTELEGTL